MPASGINTIVNMSKLKQQAGEKIKRKVKSARPPAAPPVCEVEFVLECTGPEQVHAGGGSHEWEPAGIPDEFTIEEHLRVQRQIEQRACQIWRASGDAAGHAVGNWLKAEIEVLTEFIKNRMAAAAGGTLTSTGGTPSSLAQILHGPWPMFEMKLIPPVPFVPASKAMDFHAKKI
jgi:hypothetical protein